MTAAEKENILQDSNLNGMTFKNIPDLGNYLGLGEIKCGSSRTKFLDLLGLYYNYTKDGHKIIIGERKLTPKKEINGQPPYVAFGKLFYNYLDSLGTNHIHYVSNIEFALINELLTDNYKTMLTSLSCNSKEIFSVVSKLFDLDYAVLCNELIRDKIESLAKKDIFNKIEQVWMCNGEEISNQEELKFLNERKDYVLNTWGTIINSERDTIIETKVDWGTSQTKMGYIPKDAAKKACEAVNKNREKRGEKKYYRSWKIFYVYNPYITIENGDERDIINEKRKELVDNRIKWDNYNEEWKPIYDKVRKFYYEFVEGKHEIEVDDKGNIKDIKIN